MSHWGESRFAFGEVRAVLRFDVETEEEAAAAHRKLHLLTKVMQGMADAAEARELAGLMMNAQVLNGPTMDAALDRPALSRRPCGCKGKD